MMEEKVKKGKKKGKSILKAGRDKKKKKQKEKHGLIHEKYRSSPFLPPTSVPVHDA